MMTWNRVEEKPVNEQKRRWNRKKQNKNVHSCQHSFALVTRSGCRQQFLSWPLDDSTICNAFVFNSRVRLHLLHVVPSPPLDVSVFSEEKYIVAGRWHWVSRWFSLLPIYCSWICSTEPFSSIFISSPCVCVCSIRSVWHIRRAKRRINCQQTVFHLQLTIGNCGNGHLFQPKDSTIVLKRDV